MFIGGGNSLGQDDLNQPPAEIHASPTWRLPRAETFVTADTSMSA